MIHYLLQLFFFIILIVKEVHTGAWLDDKNMMDKHFNHKIDQKNDSKEKKPLILYAVPHSHDDVGWLTTVEDYFYGSKAQGDYAAVQFTIDTVIQALQQDPKRKFVQVEMGFFTLWWNQQNDTKKEKVKELIKNNQFIIINGGWSQNDEANTYYENIIENMWVGQRFIKNELDFIPTIGWSIDPFGHSSAQSALFQQMGFNGWWFARADYQDKELRLQEKNMEFIWNPPQSSGKTYETYCSLQYNHYSAPPGFCFDSFCNNDEPIMDDPNLLNYNVDKRAKEFVEYMESMSTHYKTNRLLHVFGEDFQFTNAEMYFKNLDRLFKYINENSNDFNGFTVKYASPQEYLEDLSKDDIQLPTQTYDFFPYADNSESYWTGYFTSRVAGKGGIREQSKLFYSLRTYLGLLKFYDLSKFCENNQDLIERSLVTFEQTIGILQHHDAVTGTEKQFVSNDYMFRLQNSTDTIHNVINQVLHEQVEKLSGIQVDQDFQTYNWNATAEENLIVYEGLLAQQDVLLTVYQPKQTSEQIVRFKVPHAKFDVIDLSNNDDELQCEVVCPTNKLEQTNCDAYIKVKLEGFNLNVYLIQYNKNPFNTQLLEAQQIDETSNKPQTFQISQSKTLKLFSNSDYFEYKNCDQENTCKTEKISLSYNKYNSYQKSGQKSGAYIFRPDSETFDGSIPYSQINNKVIYKGDIVTSLNLEGDFTNSWLLFQHLNEDYDNVIEIQTYIKSIDIQDHQGKEIVLNLEFEDIKNDQIFYTDSSGLELIERKLNYRPTWNLTVTQPASGNYYPINAILQIKDSKSQQKITVLNDRPQGGTSLQEGQIEFMIHRRCLYDDGRGVGEALNETNIHNDLGLVQKVRHWVVFEQNQDSQLYRKVQYNNDLAPITYFAKLNYKVKQVQVEYNDMELAKNVKDNLKLYLRYYGSNSNTFMMRLNNLHEKMSVDYKASIPSAQETTLTANQLLSDWENNRIKWETQETNKQKDNLQKLKFQQVQNNQDLKEQQDDNQSIIVLPMQLRTFNITNSSQNSVDF